MLIVLRSFHRAKEALPGYQSKPFALSPPGSQSSWVGHLVCCSARPLAACDGDGFYRRTLKRVSSTWSLLRWGVVVILSSEKS